MASRLTAEEIANVAQRCRQAEEAGDADAYEALIESESFNAALADRARQECSGGVIRTARAVLAVAVALCWNLDARLVVEKLRRRKLEQRLDALEQSHVTYRGVWRASAEYARGDLVTHAGGLWFCWQATHEKPGTSDSWQLTAKTPR